MTDQAESDPVMEASEEELRDLSLQDAEELRAFQEKRRWFENKLQLLEAVDPIHPFAHPELAFDASSESVSTPVYRDLGPADESRDTSRKEQLPSREEVDRWQVERDALEQEVLDFDDGDLGRMKTKTRAVTQVPLTPPSTHLVELTLDLILLIDRLLSLLRVRYELLELTSLRLTWDELRWRIHWDSARIPSDLEKALLDHASRLSAHMAGFKEDQVLSRHNTSGSFTPATPRTSPRDGTESAPASPSASRHYRRQSIQASQLRSTTTAIRIRHTTLQTTSVKRAGEVMDQMIDRAASLKSLGGVKLLGLWSEPVQEGDQAGGAVPDALLDIQDEVENGVMALQRDLGHAKVVEKWMDDAERSFATYTEIRDAAIDVIEELGRAMPEPANTELATELHDRLRTAETSLRHLHALSPASSLSVSHPPTSSRLSEIAKQLESAHCAAKEGMTAAQTCMQWYIGLAAGRFDLLDHQRVVTHAIEELSQAIQAVERGQQLLRASLHDRSTDEDVKGAVLTAGTLERATEHLDNQLASTRQQLAVIRDAITRYHALSTSRPTLVIERLPKPAVDALRQDLERACASLGRITGDGSIVLKQAKRYLAVHRDLEVIQEGLITCEAIQGGAHMRLAAALQKAMWDGGGNTGMADERPYKNALTASGFAEINARTQLAWASISRGDADVDQAWVPADWRGRIKSTAEYAHGLVAGQQLLDRIHEQARRVRDAEMEAQMFVRDDGREHLGDQTDNNAEQWADSLAARIAIIEVEPLQVPSEELGVALEGVRDSQTRLRAHLNELAVRLRAASSKPVTESPPGTIAIQAKKEAAEPVKHDVIAQPDQQQSIPLSTSGPDAAERHARKLRRQIRDLRIPSLVFPSATDLSLDTRLIPSTPLVQRLSATLDNIEMECKDTAIFPLDVHSSDFYLKLKDDLAGAKAHLPRLNALATLSNAVKLCDEAFAASTALSKGDDKPVTEESLEKRKKCADYAVQAMRRAADASGVVERDARVKAEMRRIQVRWSDVARALGVFEGIAAQDAEQEEDEDAGDITSFSSTPGSPPSPASPLRRSSALPFVSPTASTNKGTPEMQRTRLPILHSLRRFPSSACLSPCSSGTRTASNPFPDRLTQATASSRNRTVSDTRHLDLTPNRKRVDSLASSISRMALSPAGDRGTPEGGAAMTARQRMRLGKVGKTASPMLKEDGGRKRERPYVPNRQSQLDVAIGDLVNQLKVDVPIKAVVGRHSSASSRPVGSTASDRRTTDEWHDESGRYWIGYAGRVKLCFCRILKSRTVMVRVGGGWMELSKFLMDHFAQVAWERPDDALNLDSPQHAQPQQGDACPAPLKSMDAPSHAIRPIPSSPASTRAPPVPSAETVTVSPSPLTPLRPKPYGLLTSARSASATPSHKTPLSAGPITPQRTPTTYDAHGDASTGGSPSLVPLHFIRKASDSPPVREMEKERFASRRSILGKGTPTARTKGAGE